jgi:ABC-type glycerol-3-phosphate transport system permease component
MDKIKFKNQPISVKVTYVLFFVMYFLFAILYVFPMFWAIMNSLKTAEEYFENSLALPQKWEFINYIRVFTDFKIRQFDYLDMLGNSLWILIVNVTCEILASAMLAYALARFRFPGKEFLYGLVIFANTIPIIGTGAASYKLLYQLNMVDNPMAIWVKWLSAFDFAFIVFYGNFKGISMTYSEAAKIDGASNLRVLFQIIFPQAFPCIAALAITSATSVWNNYSISMIYLRSYPNLSYGLYLFNTASNYIENSRPIYFAATCISCIPVILLYAASQKLILTNMTAGGLKG